MAHYDHVVVVCSSSTPEEREVWESVFNDKSFFGGVWTELATGDSVFCAWVKYMPEFVPLLVSCEWGFPAVIVMTKYENDDEYSVVGQKQRGHNQPFKVADRYAAFVPKVGAE